MSGSSGDPKFAFFEGRIVPIEQAKVSVMTHALNYGTAAFGGLRGYWNTDDAQLYLFRPIDHFTRLLNSARLLRMELPYTPESLRDILIDLIRAEDFREDIYVRPLVYKASEGIGVRLHGLKDDFTMFAMPYGSYLDKEDGLSLGTSAWRRVDDNAIPARGKISGSYANSALIKSDAVLSGYDEALVLNDDGHVAEASAANFFMFRGGVAYTPPINANVLEGITRRSVITLLSDEMGVQVVERDIDRTEVYLAEEAFLCGTGVQVAAVGSVDHHLIGDGQTGPLVSRLRDRFFAAARGHNPRYQDWTEAVYTTESTLAN